MEITPAQFAQIEHCLPRQRGNVSLTNLQVLNAILYVAEHGCKWRGFPRCERTAQVAAGVAFRAARRHRVSKHLAAVLLHAVRRFDGTAVFDAFEQ